MRICGAIGFLLELVESPRTCREICRCGVSWDIKRGQECCVVQCVYLPVVYGRRCWRSYLTLPYFSFKGKGIRDIDSDTVAIMKVPYDTVERSIFVLFRQYELSAPGNSRATRASTRAKSEEAGRSRKGKIRE
jgi:hypothetical protein